MRYDKVYSLYYNNYIAQMLRRLCQRLCNDTEDPLEDGDLRTPLFSLAGQVFEAKVVLIESFTEADVVMCYNRVTQRFRVRLEGLEAPANRPLRATLANLLPMDKRVVLAAGDFDIDGRLLVNLYANYNTYRIGDSSLNDLLLIENNMEAVLKEAF